MKEIVERIVEKVVRKVVWEIVEKIIKRIVERIVERIVKRIIWKIVRRIVWEKWFAWTRSINIRRQELINEINEKHLRDILIEIYLTNDDDFLNLCTLDALVRIVFHSTLFIVDQTLMTRSSNKSALSANISNND